MTTIANIILLLAALMNLYAILRHDLMAMRNNDYYNKRYRSWLSESGDLYSAKRLIVLAALIGSFTSMALSSWMVIIALAVVLAVLAVATLLKRQAGWTSTFTGRTASMFITAIILAILVIALGTWAASRDEHSDPSMIAATLTLMLAALSPVLVMLVNLMHGSTPRRTASPDKTDTEEPKVSD